MRILAGLLAVALCTNALVDVPNSFAAGREYRYKYRALTGSGAPLVSNQRAGIAVWADVVLTFITETKAVLQLELPEVREMNLQTDDLTSLELSSFMDQSSNLFTPLPSDTAVLTRDLLRGPIVFTIERGVVTDVMATRDEPEWSLAMKKGVLNSLQAQMSNGVKTEDTMVGRECDIIYDLVETSTNTFNLTKDFTLNSCDKLSRFRDIIGMSGFLEDVDDDIVSTSFTTSMEVSTENGRMFVKRSVAQSRFVLRPFSPEQGEIVTYTRQELDFLSTSEKTAQEPTDLILRSKTLFAPLVDESHPITDVFSFNHQLTEIKKVAMIKDLLTAASETTIEVTETDTATVMGLIRLMRGLKTKESFEDVIDFVVDNQHEQKMRPLLVSGLSHCGAPALVPALPGKLDYVEVNTVLAAMPATHMPTFDTIKALVALYELSLHQSTCDHVLLSVGSLTHGICHERRIGQINTGIECDQENKQFVVAFFTGAYERATDPIRKLVILRAIGNSGLEMTSFLRDVITDTSMSTELRESAVIAMRRCEETDKVLNTLLPVFRDDAFPAELRIASFVVMIELEPTGEMLTTLTARMGEEKCRQLGNFVYSFLTNMLEMPTIYNPSKQLVIAAQNILPTIRRFEDGIMFSKNVRFVFTSLSRRLASMISADLTHTHTQAMPRALSIRLWTFISGFYTQLFELGFRFEGLDKVLEDLTDAMYPTGDLETNPAKDRFRRELEHVRNLLDEDEVVDRKIEETRGFLFMRTLGNEVGIFHTDRITREELMSTLESLLSTPSELTLTRVLPFLPSLTLKLQSPLGLPFVAHTHAVGVVDVTSQAIDAQEGAMVARSFAPRMLMTFVTRVGSDMAVFKSLVGMDLTLKTSIPLNVILTPTETGVSLEVFVNPEEARKTPEVLELTMTPVVETARLSIAMNAKRSTTQEMELMPFNNIRDFSTSFLGLRLWMMTMSRDLTHRLPAFPLMCGAHSFRVSWQDLEGLEEFGVKGVLNLDRDNMKVTTDLTFNGRVSDLTKTLALSAELTETQMLTLTLTNDVTTYRAFITLQNIAGDMKPTMTWLEAGEDNDIELLFRAQFGENMEYTEAEQDLVIKARVGKSALQKALETLDVQTPASDCNVCEQSKQTNYRTVECRRCLMKRAWISHVEKKVFVNKNKMLENDYLTGMLTYLTTNYINMWDSEFNTETDFTSTLIDSETELLQKYMNHLETSEIYALGFHEDVHPYFTEKNVTVLVGNDKIVMTRVPMIPAMRRMDNLNVNRITDVATDRVIMPNFGTCTIDGRGRVNTLDTLEFDNDNRMCEQLLVKDCTELRTFEITTKLTNDNKRSLRVLLGENVLTLTPSATASTISVTYNGQTLSFDDDDTIEHAVFTATRQHVIGPDAANQERVTVMLMSTRVELTLMEDMVDVTLPFWLKDQVCGLCGDFNGETTRDMKLPNMTPANNVAEFVNAYTDCTRQ